MASEWARKKAEELLASSFVEHIEECQHGMWDEPGCTCGHEDLRDAIAAALDEAPELLAENEELMEAHQALGHEYEMLARERDKLKADLDAALMVLESVCPADRWINFHADPSGRVLQLLAEREAKRG